MDAAIALNLVSDVLGMLLPGIAPRLLPARERCRALLAQALPRSPLTHAHAASKPWSRRATTGIMLRDPRKGRAALPHHPARRLMATRIDWYYHRKG